MRRRGREKERTGERRMEGEGKRKSGRKRWWRWIGGERDRERGRGEMG